MKTQTETGNPSSVNDTFTAPISNFLCKFGFVGKGGSLETHHWRLSTDPEALEQMIQVMPPHVLPLTKCYLIIKGWHIAVIANGQGGATTQNVQDIMFDLDVTHILENSREIVCVPNGAKVHERKTLRRLVGRPDRFPEDSNDLFNLSYWCKKYVSDEAPFKSFKIKPRISDFSFPCLEAKIILLIRQLGYSGNISITLSLGPDIVVFPHELHKWRRNKLLRASFYLSCLWIPTWPTLYFTTSKYEVVHVLYPSSQSAEQFWEVWKEYFATRMEEAIAYKRGSTHSSKVLYISDCGPTILAAGDLDDYRRSYQ